MVEGFRGRKQRGAQHGHWHDPDALDSLVADVERDSPSSSRQNSPSSSPRHSPAPSPQDSPKLPKRELTALPSPGAPIDQSLLDAPSRPPKPRSKGPKDAKSEGPGYLGPDYDHGYRKKHTGHQWSTIPRTLVTHELAERRAAAASRVNSYRDFASYSSFTHGSITAGGAISMAGGAVSMGKGPELPAPAAAPAAPAETSVLAERLYNQTTISMRRSAEALEASKEESRMQKELAATPTPPLPPPPAPSPTLERLYNQKTAAARGWTDALETLKHRAQQPHDKTEAYAGNARMVPARPAAKAPLALPSASASPSASSLPSAPASARLVPPSASASAPVQRRHMTTDASALTARSQPRGSPASSVQASPAAPHLPPSHSSSAPNSFIHERSSNGSKPGANHQSVVGQQSLGVDVISPAIQRPVHANPSSGHGATNTSDAALDDAAWAARAWGSLTGNEEEENNWLRLLSETSAAGKRDDTRRSSIHQGVSPCARGEPHQLRQPSEGSCDSTMNTFEAELAALDIPELRYLE